MVSYITQFPSISGSGVQQDADLLSTTCFVGTSLLLSSLMAIASIALPLPATTRSISSTASSFDDLTFSSGGDDEEVPAANTVILLCLSWYVIEEYELLNRHLYPWDLVSGNKKMDSRRILFILLRIEVSNVGIGDRAIGLCISR
ncbi:hypothetical protein Tco_0640006 [Tanacetum coccineum]